MLQSLYKARKLAIGAVLALLLPAAARAASIWALDVSKVWDIPGGAKIAWNPALGQIGNMGNAGVKYNIAAPPAAAQAGAAAAAGSAFQAWNLFGAIPTVRINFVSQAAAAGANIPLSWGMVAGAPGEATGVAPGYNPDPIILNQNRVLRTDGWNLDYNGTRPGLIDEYDVRTTAVHEVGHPLGLGHPDSLTQVMTPQDAARQNAGGSWRAVEQTTPFAGQPLKLSGAAQPNGALDYKNPRATFGFGDAMGAMTLYSGPIARISTFLTPNGVGRSDYTYTVDNKSANGTVDGMSVRSAYDTHTVIIPVASNINVTNLMAPIGWSIVRESNDVLVSFNGTDATDAIPGGTLTFSFNADSPHTSTEPTVDWSIEGLGCATGSTDDNRGCATPSFDISNFGVNGGMFDYSFNAATDHWDVVPLDMVLTPQAQVQVVPEPGSGLLLAAGLLGIVAVNTTRNRFRRKSQRTICPMY